MGQNLRTETVMSNVVVGLPRVAELIATIPEAGRSRALTAAEESYRNTARELGYEEADALEWASAIMSKLKIEISEQDAHAQSPI